MLNINTENVSFNKLMSVCYASVLLSKINCIISDNIVKVAVEPRAAGEWFRN